MQDAAYEQVRTLQPYLFTGYPDSAFDGKRMLARFEFAAALQRMCQWTECGLNSRTSPSEAWLRSGPATRADSPWKRVRASAADNPLRELSPLVQEFSPELKLLGADLDRVKEGIQACLQRGLVPPRREGAVSIWDAVRQMETLPSPKARAETAVRLLRDEVPYPSPDTQYLAGRDENTDHLQGIIVTAADSHAEAGTLLDVWRNTDKGRLHDCLTLLLGRLGVANVREELRVCAADAEMPQPLRVMAVEALRNATSAADIQLLVRLVSSDGAAYRGHQDGDNCAAHGPEGWHYLIRRTARDVLARLAPSDASVAALVKHTVDHAVLFEKLAASER